jgi:hypothetical protein
MKRNYGSFLGFAVLVIAAMFTAAGCDMDGDDGTGGGSIVDGNGNPDPSKLSGTVWQSIDPEDGYTSTLTFTGTSAFSMLGSDGYMDSGTYSVSGKTIIFKSGTNTITATIIDNGKKLRVADGGDFTRIGENTGNGPSETAQSGYYGIWVNDNNVSRVITQTTYKLQGSNWSYTMAISSWTPVTNTNTSTSNAYPNGYVISGTITAHTGSTRYDSKTGEPLPGVGGSFFETVFLRTDKQVILKSETGANNYGSTFTKQY